MRLLNRLRTTCVLGHFFVYTSFSVWSGLWGWRTRGAHGWEVGLAHTHEGRSSASLKCLKAGHYVQVSCCFVMQVTRLHAAFSHNMAAINFYLRYCVLQNETQVFPERMACTPWHLSDAAKNQVVGFSGTKDNHRLLPLHVHQASPQDSRLKATDGKMLHLLLDTDKHTPKYFSLITEKVRNVPASNANKLYLTRDIRFLTCHLCSY
jgi:hypothetical protein